MPKATDIRVEMDREYVVVCGSRKFPTAEVIFWYFTPVQAAVFAREMMALAEGADSTLSDLGLGE